MHPVQVELKATKVVHVGGTDPAEYPLAKKKQVGAQSIRAACVCELALAVLHLQWKNTTLL